MTESKHNNESSNGSDAPQQAGLRPRGAAAAACGNVDSRIGREGDTSNTPSPKTISGGEDWLTLSLYVEHSNLKELKIKLDDAKKASKFDHAPFDEIRIGFEQFRVMPVGGRLGSQKKGAWMSWLLQSELGVTFMLMDCEKPTGEQPNCSVRVTSQTLMQFTTKAIWTWVQDCLDGMGARLVDNKLSRVDACVDLPNVDVSKFVTPFRAGWIVSRARSLAEYDQQMRSSVHYTGSRQLGFTIGKGPISIRVYDKLTESQKSPA
ncbi:MAG: hypothetical protein NXI22_09045, partial [bacterium]|nr:hypothetical protein [bacterium]